MRFSSVIDSLTQLRSAILSLKFDFQSFSLSISSFQSLVQFRYAIISLSLSLSLFLFVFYGFVDVLQCRYVLQCRFVIYVPSLVFELSLSIKVEFNHHPPKPDPTRPVVFCDKRRSTILQTNGIELVLG